MKLGSVSLEERGMVLHIAASEQGPARDLYANYHWLRDNCPSSFDARIGDRQYDIVADSTELRPSEARQEGDDLVIVWSGDGHFSRFDLGWLCRWLERPGHPDPARVAKRFWTAGSASIPKRFQFTSLTCDRSTARAYLGTLLGDGIALVEHVPDSDEGVRLVAEVAGHVRATFSGTYFDVKSYAKPVGTAYTAQALEPHTDSPCEAYPGWIQYLHCRVNDATGGETTFVDGAAAGLRASFGILHPLPFLARRHGYACTPDRHRSGE